MYSNSVFVCLMSQVDPHFGVLTLCAHTLHERYSADSQQGPVIEQVHSK